MDGSPACDERPPAADRGDATFPGQLGDRPVGRGLTDLVLLCDHPQAGQGLTWQPFTSEVYGYSRARRVIWSGFGALIFASVMAYIVVSLPPASFWKHHTSLSKI